MLLTAKMIKTACPGANSDFVLKHLEASQLNAHYTLDDVRADFAQGDPRRTTAAAPVPGKNPEDTWHDLVATYMAKGMDRPKAVGEVARRHPAINMAYLDAYNLEHGGERPNAQLKELHLDGGTRGRR